MTKMQGLGNDFVVIDYDEYSKCGLQMSELAKKICDRNFGVGADGMIIPNLKESSADIGWYFYNSDGTTAQMCGNGMRCFAKYVYDKGYVNKTEFGVKTLAGLIRPEILENGLVKVDMGTPILENSKIPYVGQSKKLKIADKVFEINPVSMGNPHCVIFGCENPLALAEKYGPEIENHPSFPEKTNVEFVKIILPTEIEMRVWERGCGITLACGTGACASTVAGILNNLTQNKVKVHLLGGALTVEWQGNKDNPTEHVFMTGSADYVFDANFYL